MVSRYKTFLLFLKHLPFAIALLTLIVCILNCFGIYSKLLANFCFYSPITAGFMLYTSSVFQNCIWHRLPIYYSIILEIITYINLYIPISGRIDLFIYLTLTILFIILGMYFKNNTNKKRHQSVIDSA